MPKGPKILVDNVRPEDCVSILLSMRRGVAQNQEDLESKARERGVMAVQSLFRSVYRLEDLGIIKSDDNQGVSLTEFGARVKNVLIRDELLFHELMHHLHMLSALDKTQKPYFRTYYLITKYLFTNRGYPDIKARERILAAVLPEIEAGVNLPRRPSLDDTSVTKVVWWLSKLSPPFVIPGARVGQKSFVPRVNPRIETAMMAISGYYSILGLPFGTPFLLDKDALTDICAMGLIDESGLVKILSRLSQSYQNVEVTDTVHGKSLMLKKQFSVEDLE